MDLISCNILGDENWQYVIRKIYETTGIKLRTSNNITGINGDWILESDNVNLVGLYFSEKIKDYAFDLDMNEAFNALYCFDDNTLYTTSLSDANNYYYSGQKFWIPQMATLPNGITCTQMSCGTNYMVMVGSDGYAYSCGVNTYGQLGTGNTSSAANFVRISMPSGVTQIKQVSCGNLHTVIIGHHNASNYDFAYSCGYNSNGQLGTNDTTNKLSFTMMTMPSDVSVIKQVSCGDLHTVVIGHHDASNIDFGYACGENLYGKTGLGINSGNSLILTKMTMPTNVNNIIQVACSRYHTIAIGYNTSVSYNKYYGCGNNGTHQYSNANVAEYTTLTEPTSLPSGFGAVSKISCGDNTSYIIANDTTINKNKLYVCGVNTQGQLGRNNTTNVSSITSIIDPSNVDYYVDVVGSLTHVTVIAVDTSSNTNVYSCGNYSNGRLGLGVLSSDQLTLTKITTNASNISQLSTCGFCSPFSAYINNLGKLLLTGTSGTNLNSLFPKLYTSHAYLNVPSDIVQIAYGQFFVVVLTVNGYIYGCGINNKGQLGQNNTTKQLSFVQIPTPNSILISQIACGYEYLMAVGVNGKLYGCGINGNGQLGMGNNTNLSVLTEVSSTSNIGGIAYVACGVYHTIILGINNLVYGCGFNGSGQLGINNTTGKTSFTQLSLPCSYANKIACGGFYTTILGNDNLMYGCGDNSMGQLGLTDASNRYILTQATLPNTITSIKNIKCGYEHTIIIGSDDLIYGCGRNTYGQLGINNTTNKNILTQSIIPSGKNIAKQIMCTANNTYSIWDTTSSELYACGANSNALIGDETTSYRATFTKVKKRNISNVDEDFTNSFLGNMLIELTSTSSTLLKLHNIIHTFDFNTNISTNTSLYKIYTSSDNSVATINSNGIVSILSAGTTTITISQWNTSASTILNVQTVVDSVQSGAVSLSTLLETNTIQELHTAGLPPITFVQNGISLFDLITNGITYTQLANGGIYVPAIVNVSNLPSLS
jgi:alpha-tubulin suppressor-like RCC1 family protein